MTTSAPPRSIANVVSIAGIDPSGGAGLLADLKTFSMPMEMRMPVMMVGAAAGRITLKAVRNGPTSRVRATFSHSLRTLATPKAVLRETSVATSAGVPRRRTPPLPV